MISREKIFEYLRQVGQLEGSRAMTDEQKTFLDYASRRYIWWGEVNDLDVSPQKAIAQVMNIGTWDDLCRLVALFSPQELLGVLNAAEIGQFNERSWHFWHNWLSGKIPPMPERKIS
jgi:hypothetical protein